MERISIFNYEAFYLDFLEGNLNEEDTLLLMSFLEANPNLQVEMDDELPIFEEENEVLDNFSKLMLKLNIDEEVITSENVDYFIIAHSEGLLDEVKSKELLNFVSGSFALKNESRLAGLVHFEVNPEIVYADKSELKKKNRVIVLWPYFTAIAAASVVLFFWSLFGSSPLNIEPKSAKTYASKSSNGKIEKSKSETQENQLDNIKNGASPQNNAGNTVSKDVYSIETKENSEKKLHVNNMKSNAAGPIATINEQKLAPIGTRYSNPTNTANQHNEADVLALSPKSEMHNPIEPLTKFVSKKTNTEIDFKTTEKVEDERRGFHLKIGKFEISRNKRR